MTSRAHRTELPILAGVAAGAWQQGYERIDGELNTGRLSKSEGFGQILRECGADPRPDLVRALVDMDRELGIRAAQIVRGARDGKVLAAGTTVVRSLADVDTMFWD